MRTKRFLSIVLTLAILLGMFPGMSLTASAEDTTTEITPSNTSGTMTITLTIKAAQTITASDVTATYGDTDKSVSASVTTPTTGGGAISYAVKDGSGDYIDVASDGKLTIKKVPSDGKAYVTVTAAATDDYAAATKDVTVNINTKAMTVSADNVTATVDGQPHGITVNVTDPASGATVKYGTEEGSYTLDASPTQTEAGTKTVYYQVTADNYTTYNGSATVTVSAKQTQTITASDVNATYGDTDKKIEATTTSGGGALSYAVKSGDAVNVDNSGNLTIVKAGSAVITVTAAENDTYASATKDVNVTVNTKAMTVSAEDVNVTVDGQPHGITVNVTDPASSATVKYGTEEGSYTLDASPTQTEVGEKTVYYQVTADNYTTYTGSAKVTVSAKQTQTITADDVTVTYGDADKKVTATTNGGGAISYAVKAGSEDYIEVNATTGALTIKKVPSDGKAYVTVTAAGTATYEQAIKEVTVTINKADAVAATVTANNRIYDGTEKPLVTVTGEATGGEMQYALGTATEATQPYTTSIPSKTDAGTYYVWYKVAGDGNHTDSEASAPVTVAISPVNKAALNEAISAAEAYYDEIRGNADYAAIAETLKEAIDAAKALAGNANATEDQVSAATSRVAEAKKTAKADKEAAEKQAADEAAAKAVTDDIQALSDNAGTGDKDAVAKARAAYEALTEDQKKLVPAEALSKLTAAEASVKAAEEAASKQAADEAAAKAVTDAIRALSDNAGTDDKDAVAKTRAAYDALTEDQKKLIPEDVLARLTTAEQQVREAEEAADPVDIADCKITVKNQAYTGKALKPAVTVKHGKVTLKKGADYTVSYKNNVKPGTATVTVKGKGHYTGAAKVTFLIRVPMSKCKVTVKNQTYTGKALKPAVTVKYGKVTLKKGTDYTVTYTNNKEIGRATVTVKGKGMYAGTKRRSFKIKPKTMAFTKLTGGNKQITLKWKNPNNVTGYYIQCSLKKDFSTRRTVKIKQAQTASVTFKRLRANRTYYVRIRTYATVNNKNYYSPWSKVMTVATKTGKAKNGPDALDVEAAVEADEMTLTLDEELDGALLMDEIIDIAEALPEDDIVLTLAE